MPNTKQEEMVERQIVGRGMRDEAVLAAMRAVPRSPFVPEEFRSEAHADSPLPIGEAQTISQPFVVAHMAEALDLNPTDRVLEVGSGSGYASAVLAQLADHVFGVEHFPELAERSRETLRELHFDNVTIVCGDGTLGLPDEAPFDAIMVSAAAPETPAALFEQLAEGGRLVIPIGSRYGQQLMRFERHGDEFAARALGDVRFVPLIADRPFDEAATPRAEPDE